VILVTGATGRVGYRLMEALADAHADATGLPVTYLAPSGYMENLVYAADTIRTTRASAP